MLRALSTLTVATLPGALETFGVITGPGPAPGSYQVSIRGRQYTQVFSVNFLSYRQGATVRVVFLSGIPRIVP